VLFNPASPISDVERRSAIPQRRDAARLIVPAGGFAYEAQATKKEQ
jgi:hypothetical protein